jgi:hypothetical protein
MGCFLDQLSNLWVLLYESLFSSVGIRTIERESLVRSKLMQDLENMESTLCESEGQLELKVEKFRALAKEMHVRGDGTGAKRKLRESLQSKGQLERVRTSLTVISAQLGAIANTELNSSLYSILKLSSETMGKLKVEGREEVEDVSLSIQESIQRASDMNDVMSMPFGTTVHDITDMELDEELNLLTQSTHSPVAASPHGTTLIANEMAETYSSMEVERPKSRVAMSE